MKITAPYRRGHPAATFWFSAELASDSEQPSPKQRYISSEDFALKPLSTGNGPASNRCTAFIFTRTLRSRDDYILPARWRAAPNAVWLNWQLKSTYVLMRYINRLSDCLYAPPAEDSDARTKANIIREVSKRYLAAVASRPAVSETTRPWPSHSLSAPAHPRRR